MSQPQGQGSADPVVEMTARHSYGTWRIQKGWKPRHIVSGAGCYFTDSEGKRYLDFSSQLVCVNLGHGNEAVMEAIDSQARRLQYIAPSFTTDARAELNGLLLEVMPEGLTKFFYSTSGTEANEAAMKIARLYTGRSKIVTRYHSYHGSTSGSMSASGDWRRWFVEPAGKMPGMVHAPDLYCYRCPFNLTYPECGVACAEYFNYLLSNEHDVAAILVEPVVGANGILVPVKEYLPTVARIAKEHDVLLIADEVMCGWGRTGEWFAVDNWGVKPDILTTAKGITSAYMPLGLTATSERIAQHFEDHMFAHGHTYEGHPMTLAAAVATIKEYRRLNAIENAKRMGGYLGSRLEEVKKAHPSVGDVRGIGLLWGVELTKDGRSRKPFNTKEEKANGITTMVEKISVEMMKMGVYVFGMVNLLVVAPPLIVGKEEIDQGIDALDEALKMADREVESRT